MALSDSAWRRSLPYAVMICVFVAVAVYVVNAVPARTTQAAGPGPSPTPTFHGDGLSDSHDGYLMRPVALPTARGSHVPISFQILGRNGTAVVDYEIVQTKPMHLYLIRDDLSGYQHLHPTLTKDVWSVRADLDDGGAYRLYAEFTPRMPGVAGHSTTLGLPFVITGDTRLAPLPGPAASASVAGYTITRQDGVAHLLVGESTVLRFQVSSRSGTPALEEHLGALAHMSAFEVRTQALSHVHAAADPATGTLAFHVLFPNRGEQRLFLEFKAAGQVHRTAFTVFVT